MPRVDPQWIRGPADELAVAQGHYFDEAAGRFVCEFIETFCCPSEGPGAGKPLVLLPWQRDFVMRLFGWKRPDGLRRYRRVYLEIPKKNGKSMLITCLVLVLLMIDGEASPQIYLNACDKDQAAIVFDEARKMIEASPELDGRLDVVNSKQDRRIVFPANNGVVYTNSSVVDSKDGRNAHGVIFDELHRQPDRRLYEVFEYATIARAQPLHIDITTAGEDNTGVWHDQREYAERNNAGLIEPPDLTFLGIVYRADPERDDVDDPATWRKANPSLGFVLTEEEFASSLKRARETPAEYQNFLRLRLNVIARDEGKFLFPADWEACGPGPRQAKRADLSAFRGRPCFAGGDLSSKVDLTALVAVWKAPGGFVDVACWAYLPEQNIAALEKRDRVPYRAWAAAGWLTLTPGVTVDYGFLRAEVKRLHSAHKLAVFAVDPHNATQLNTELAEQDGVNVMELQQGFLSLSDPTKELEALVLSRRLRHDGNPVLSWCVLNAVAEKDAAGNVKLSKKKSRLKIDCAAALVDAIAGMLSAGPAAGPSVYQSRGILTL